MKLEKKEQFAKELEQLINRLSLESECDMPDWIIANYLVGCFDNLCAAKKSNDRYHGITETDENFGMEISDVEVKSIK